MAMSELKQKLLIFELARLGFPEAAYDPEKGRVILQADVPSPIMVDDSGSVFYTMEDRDVAMEKVRPLAESVNEAVAAWEMSQPVPVGNLPEFRVMAEYNNTVLAARDDTGLGAGLHYVTWEYNGERTGMYRGNYTEDYAYAKQDFAVRAGLVPKEKLLTPEHAAAIRVALEYRFDNDFEMRPATEDVLKEAARKLERGYPGPIVKDYSQIDFEADPDLSQDMELQL